ncbi:MAG TPA: protocatechuate 3,4-dioxygenase [Gemmatimonadales bacterium]|jgi:protocatechuate 3,4-dioxygenase beta subunit|nr:protocatechuate 3,4-dioxygenase [Gemmatimonadales bacterium]
MAQDHPISRRELLGAGAGAAAGLVAQRLAGEVPPAAACGDPTAAQTAGPYYPSRDRPDEDPDLTRVKGREGRAAGEVVVVRGTVLDEACRPIAGALVEIWQANTHGRYDHERDAGNPRPLDPNFQSWAEMLTDNDGGFRFTTIKPGAYPADDSGWVRPPHIHFRVSRRGYHELVTQMYFAGETLNDADRIRLALSPEERDRATVTFDAAGAESEARARLGRFDITLRQVT